MNVYKQFCLFWRVFTQIIFHGIPFLGGHEKNNAKKYGSFLDHVLPPKIVSSLGPGVIFIYIMTPVLYTCDWDHGFLGSIRGGSRSPCWSGWLFHDETEWRYDTVDGSEIRRSPVEMVNIPLLTGFENNPRWLAGFLPSTVLHGVRLC